MAPQHTTQETIDLAIARIWMDPNRVVHIEFKPTDTHSIDEARQIVAAHNQLAQGTPCAVLADITQLNVGADRSARQHYVSEESSQFKSAMAMVTESPFQKMIGNFFFRMNRPPYPTRMFRHTDTALEWLAEFAH